MSEPCWLAANGLLELDGRLVPIRFAPAPDLRECEGRRDPCHLIPRRLLRTEFPEGAYFDGSYWRPALGPTKGEYRALELLLRDSRIIVEGCRRHHRLLDEAKKLRLPRAALPASAEEFAAELGPPITSWLDREYGPTEVAA
jgi:hypothetical protein